MTQRTSENVQYFTGASWEPQSETHHDEGPGVTAHDGSQVPGPISHMTWTAPNGVEMTTPATITLGPGDDWDPEGKAFVVVKSLEDGRRCTRIAGYPLNVDSIDLDAPVREVWTVCQKYEAWREVR